MAIQSRPVTLDALITNMDKLIVAIIGFCSGAVGSLVAPWVNWGIEKRRDRRNERKYLIDLARKYIHTKDFGGFGFVKTDVYIQLKPYLSKPVVEFVENFERAWECADDSSTLQCDLKTAVLSDLQRLERKWGLK